MEGDVSDFEEPDRYPHFNPLPPHGGRPVVSGQNAEGNTISIHSLRMEGDYI